MQLSRYTKVYQQTKRYSSNYHFIPGNIDSMEGRWNGETTTVPAQTDGNQVCSCDLLFRSEEGNVSSDPLKSQLIAFIQACGASVKHVLPSMV